MGVCCVFVRILVWVCVVCLCVFLVSAIDSAVDMVLSSKNSAVLHYSRLKKFGASKMARAAKAAAQASRRAQVASKS